MQNECKVFRGLITEEDMSIKSRTPDASRHLHIRRRALVFCVFCWGAEGTSPRIYKEMHTRKNSFTASVVTTVDLRCRHPLLLVQSRPSARPTTISGRRTRPKTSFSLSRQDLICTTHRLATTRTRRTDSTPGLPLGRVLTSAVSICRVSVMRNYAYATGHLTTINPVLNEYVVFLQGVRLVHWWGTRMSARGHSSGHAFDLHIGQVRL